MATHVIGALREPRTKKGFATLSKELRKHIARLGGKAAHMKGTAHRFTSVEARNAGRKGGQSISKDRKHMASIGRRGGLR